MPVDYQIAYVDENDGNKIKFGFGGAHKKTSPTAGLVQRVLKLLFTKIGSHQFAPLSGSLFADIVNGGLSKNDQEKLISFVSVGIADVEQYIKAEQKNEVTFLPEERLSSIKLLDVSAYPDGSWDIEIIIYNESGAAYLAKVEK